MNEQTIDGVPREWVENYAGLLEEHHMTKDAKKVRALLDAPAEKFNPKGWAIDHSAGRPILVHNNCSVIEAEQAYGLLELIKSAVQPQGDPVAWIKPDVAKTLTKDECCYAFGSQNPKGTLIPLYAEQPAPVAVVMPERREIGPNYPYLSDLDIEWSSCLDEVKRLNK